MNYGNHEFGSRAFATGAPDLPDESHSSWSRVIRGEFECEFEFLALRILLARLNSWGRTDESPERMRDAVRELRGLFEKSGKVPSARRDLQRIFGWEQKA